DDDLLNMRDQGADAAESRELVREILGLADLVFVSTEELQSRFSSLARQLVVERNAIAERPWLSPLEEGPAEIFNSLHGRKTDTEIRAIYFGTKTHQRDLEIVKLAVVRLREAYPQFRLFTVGVTDQVS